VRPIIPADHATPPEATPGTGTGERGIPAVRRATGDAELGRKLRKCRLERGHYLKQPARFAGISQSTLSDYEAGRGELPCEGCGLPPSDPHGYVTYDVPEGEPEGEPERCGTCGRRMWFVIEVRKVEGGGVIPIG
jgi:hypothetical protein